MTKNASKYAWKDSPCAGCLNPGIRPWRFGLVLAIEKNDDNQNIVLGYDYVGETSRIITFQSSLDIEIKDHPSDNILKQII